MANLREIEGVGDLFARKLEGAGVRSVEALLQQGATPAGRKKIEADSGITSMLILRWVHHADLFRVRGVNEEYADLLEAAGVVTLVELATRDAENLVTRMTGKHIVKSRVRRLPTESQVQHWIDEAKTLPRLVI